MTITQVTVTGTYPGATSAGSSVTFTPLASFTDGVTVVPTTPTVCTLDASQRILGTAPNIGANGYGVILPATDDPSTSPPGVLYEITEAVIFNGQTRYRTYVAALPHANATVDVSQLQPATVPPPTAPLQAETLRAKAAEAALSARIPAAGELAPMIEASMPAATSVPAGTRVYATDTSTEWEAIGGAWVRTGETKVVHRWSRDGANGIGWQAITMATAGEVAWTGRLATATTPPHGFSVQPSSRGRFTGTIPDSNLRVAYMLDGTNWQDSEVRSVWYPPSAVDPAKITPQMAHVHRAGPTGAIVVDQNIATYVYSSTWAAVWNWPASPPGDLPSIDPAAALYRQDYSTTVLAYMMISATQAYVAFASNTNFASGDSVTFAGLPAALNGTKTLGAAYLGGWLVAVTGATPGVTTPCYGTVTFAAPAANAENPKLGYPMHVASRVTTPPGGNPASASTLTLKTWPTTWPEPSWQDANRTISVPLVSSSNTVPTIGKCGIMVNHVHDLNSPAQYVEFSDVEMTRL